jgi:hypothetical protein
MRKTAMSNQNNSWLNEAAKIAVAVVSTAVLLSACATAPDDYRPLGVSGVGYTDQALGPNRYMVAVSGSRAIARDDVERFVLRRAAEVTLREGYTHFTLTDEDVEASTFFWPGSDTYLHGPNYARRAGLWPEYPDMPQTRYSATAEVTMLRPDEASGNPQAIEARSVL